MNEVKIERTKGETLVEELRIYSSFADTFIKKGEKNSAFVSYILNGVIDVLEKTKSVKNSDGVALGCKKLFDRLHNYLESIDKEKANECMTKYKKLEKKVN